MARKNILELAMSILISWDIFCVLIMYFFPVNNPGWLMIYPGIMVVASLATLYAYRRTAYVVAPPVEDRMRLMIKIVLGGLALALGLVMLGVVVYHFDAQANWTIPKALLGAIMASYGINLIAFAISVCLSPADHQPEALGCG